MIILSNELRIGNFSSSRIADLLTNGKEKGTLGKPALTYISEKNMERRLVRSVSNENDARPLQWGHCLEMMVHEKLGIEYTMQSDITLQHPTIHYWVGSPDGKKIDTITDIKNPITLKSFCQLVDPFYIDGLTGLDWFNAIRNGWTDKNGEVHEKHKEAEDYYWQLVSNAIITGSKFAELIIHVPYKSELEIIRQWGEDIYWIKNGSDESLTWIPDDGFYKDLNIIRFEIPESDKQFLESKVIMAGKLLINPCQLIILKVEPKS